MSLTQLELFSIDSEVRDLLLNQSEYQLMVSTHCMNRSENILYRHRETRTYFSPLRFRFSLEFVLMMSDQCSIDYTKKVAILYRSDLNSIKRTEREYSKAFWEFIDKCEKQLIKTIELIDSKEVVDYHGIHRRLLTKLVLIKAYLGKKSEVIPDGVDLSENCSMTKAHRKINAK